MRITRLAICCLLGLSFGVASAQKATNYLDLRLIQQKTQFEAETKKQHAIALANLLNIPIREERPDGTILELMEFRNGRPLYLKTDNVNAATSTRANRVHPGGGAGLSLTGSGVVIGVWDGGAVRTTHQEFGGRATVMDGSTALSSHATHVAGTIIASGVDASAKGMSYAGTVHSRDWNSDESEMAAAAGGGLLISNHSYGFITGWYWSGSAWYWYGDVNLSTVEDVGFGYYDSTAQNWDNIAYNAPYYLPVKSAGNDRNQGPSAGTQHFYWNGSAWTLSTDTRNIDGNSGYDSIAWHGVAKNIMTIAAVNDVLNYTSPSSVGMSSFSGWGPTDDGRIKPDISANGVGLYSSIANTDSAYSSFSGTSMSSPNTSGSLGLLVEHYRDTHANADMLAATLKALAIHTAQEAGSADGPDYAFGWGLLNAEQAAAVITEDVSRDTAIQELTLANSETKTMQVYSDGTQPLRVTIAWTDPAHSPATYVLDSPDLMLVNDLDLRVQSPSGGTTMPWILDPANPSAAATKGDNFRDNVEQVLIPTTEAGFYTISVSHKGASLAPSGQQAFSMIVGGQTDAPQSTELTSLTLSVSSIGGGNSLSGTVTLSSSAGGTVSLSSSNSAASVPTEVVVPSGSTSANFTINTGAVAATTNATISASMDGVTKTQDLQVKAALLTGVSVSPSSVEGGDGSTGTVTVSGNIPASGITINLSSSHSAASVPSTVTIPQGQTSADFNITTTTVNEATDVTISAAFDGTNKSTTLTVTAALDLGSLSIVQSAVYETKSATGVITLTQPAPAGGFDVAISEVGGTSSLIIASIVTVPEGQTTKNFVIGTKDIGPNPVVRTVRATANGIVKEASFTINPIFVTGLTLDPVRIKGGGHSTGTVTITTPAGPNGVVVTLSDNSTFAEVPVSITIPFGSNSASFTVVTSMVRRREYATIVATRNGKSVSAVLQIDKNNSGGGGGIGR